VVVELEVTQAALFLEALAVAVLLLITKMEDQELQTPAVVLVELELMQQRQVEVEVQVWSLLAIHPPTQSAVGQGLPLQPQLSALTRSQHSLLALAQ
jgi:hypothetical protein